MRIHKRLALRTLQWLGRDVTRLSGAGDFLLTRRDSGGDDDDQHDQLLGAFLLRRHLAHILEQARINCVLDVGANRGQYACMVREIGYRGRIASFEPVPSCVHELQRLAAGDPNWTIHPCALGRRDALTTFNITENSVFSSVLKPNDYSDRAFGPAGQVVQRLDVVMRRLDGVMDEVLRGVHEPRVLLKLDTQGYDLEAFAGLGDRLRNVHALQAEISMVPIYEGMPRMLESLGLYAHAGFEITGMFPVNREHLTSRIIEFDCVMVRTAAPAALSTDALQPSLLNLIEPKTAVAS